MAEIAFSVDRLDYSVPTRQDSVAVDIPSQAIPAAFWEGVDFTVDRKYIRKAFYDECMNLGPMFVFAKYDEKRHHAFVEMHADACDEFEMRAYLDASIHGLSARVTRLDLALDVYDSGFSVADLRLAMKDGKVKAASDETLYIDKSMGEKGATLYVGGTNSDCRMRFYDKGLEQETTQDWKRLEVVLRRDKARVYAHSVCEEGIEIAARRFFGSAFFGWSELTLWLSAGEQVEPLRVASNRKINSERWLRTVALRAVLDAIDKNNEEVIHWLERKLADRKTRR